MSERQAAAFLMVVVGISTMSLGPLFDWFGALWPELEQAHSGLPRSSASRKARPAPAQACGRKPLQLLLECRVALRHHHETMG